jgi:hypothetical protein
VRSAEDFYEGRRHTFADYLMKKNIATPIPRNKEFHTCHHPSRLALSLISVLSGLELFKNTQDRDLKIFKTCCDSRLLQFCHSQAVLSGSTVPFD